MSYLSFAKALASSGGLPTVNKPTLHDGNPSYQFPDDLWLPGQDPFIYFNIRKAVGDIKPYGNISLYMPATIKVDYGAGWDDLEMTSEKTKALTGIDMGSAIGGLSRGQVSDTFKQVLSQTGQGASAESIAQYAAGNVAGATLGGASTSFEVRKAMSGEGKAVNPFTSMLYQGPKLREFQFDFSFFARTPNESEQIKNIIKAFKMAMHPQMDPASSNLFYIYPYVFDVFLITPAVDRMFNIKRAVLTNMSVDYAAGSGPSFFNTTWSPVNIKMSLSFKELELLTQADIDKDW